MEVENILFYGASGKLGKHWVKNLLDDNKIFANLNRNKLLFKKKKFFKVKLNLKNPKKIFEFSKQNKITIIINCTGLTNVETCEFNEKKALKINYFIPSELCKIAKKLDVPFIHISTDMLFNGKSNNKYDEKSYYSPLNIYSKTKIKAEKYVLKYKKSLVIRTNFFGFGTKNNQTITDKLIDQQKSGKDSFLWKDIYFSPVYIPNLIFFINLLIKSRSYGIFNISSDRCISKYNFGSIIAKHTIKDAKIFSTTFSTKTFVNRPKNMCLNNNKLKKKFKKYSYKLKFNYQINCFSRDYKIINES